MQVSGQSQDVVHKRDLHQGRRHHTHLWNTQINNQPLSCPLPSVRFITPHHHGDDREEVPVALDSSERKGDDVSKEDHGRTKADDAQDLKHIYMYVM